MPKLLKDCSMKELNDILDNAIRNNNILDYKDQMFEYENYRRICILDKSQNVKYFNELFRQTTTEKAIDAGRETPSLKFNNNVVTKCYFDAEFNELGLSQKAITGQRTEVQDGFVLYQKVLVHENTHADDYLTIKCQKSDDEQLIKYQDVRQTTIAKDMKGLIATKSNIKIETESNLKLLTVAYATNKAIAKHQSKLSDLQTKVFSYLNILELRARNNELSDTKETLYKIDKIEDLHTRINTFNALRNTIYNSTIFFYNLAHTDNDKLLNEYFAFCEKHMTGMLSPEKRIYDKQKFEDSTTKLLEKVYQDNLNIINTIDKQIDLIEKQTRAFLKQPAFNNLKQATNTIFNQDIQNISNQEIADALKTMEGHFDIDYLKYQQFSENKNNEHNLKFITDKLYEIYETRCNSKTPVEIQMEDSIKNIFYKIFQNEKNVYLIDAHISNNVIKLADMATILSNNIDTKNFDDKLKDYRTMVALDKGIIQTQDLSQQNHIHNQTPR